MKFEKKHYRIEKIDYEKYPPLYEREFIELFEKVSHDEDIGALLIGIGTHGDKLKKIIEHAKLLKHAGFHIPKIVSLGSDLFDRFHFINALTGGFLERMPYEEREEKFLHGKIDQQLTILILEVSKYFDNHDALYIRSSAIGDASGNGVRDSVPVKNDFESIALGIKAVLASDASEKAESVRKAGNLQKGLGIIIMPVIGKRYGNIVAPMQSGYIKIYNGVSFPELGVGPGLGGGIDIEKKYILFNKADDWEKLEDTTKNYLRSYHTMSKLRKEGFDIKSVLLETYHQKNISVFDLHSGEISILEKDIGLRNDSLNSLKDNIHLLRKLDLLRNISGKSFRLEFALSNRNEWHITQSNEIENKSENKERLWHENAIGLLNGIENSKNIGIKYWIVIDANIGIDRIKDWLESIDQDNESFCVVFRSYSWQSANEFMQSTEKSSMIIFDNNVDHLNPPIDHIGGASNLMGKGFGVLAWNRQREKKYTNYINSKFIEKLVGMGNIIHEKEPGGDDESNRQGSSYLIEFPLQIDMDYESDSGIIYFKDEQ